MKYQIVVEKEHETLYFAYCPVMPDIRAEGENVNQALTNIRRELLCYLHDAGAEFEIMFEAGGARGAESAHGAVQQ
jgi:predicted RNase H-like HicB family nuclease